jgi:AGZA family xanthine/uracil permease-like MFS transporter
LLPGVAGWGAILAKNSLRVTGMGLPGGQPFTDKLVEGFHRSSGTYIEGAFALEQGFIFASMILAAATVAVIGRRFVVAAGWCAVGAALSVVGLMHTYQWTFGDTVIQLASSEKPLPGLQFAEGYAAMGVVFLLAQWLTVEGEGH